MLGFGRLLLIMRTQYVKVSLNETNGEERNELEIISIDGLNGIARERPE